MLSSLTTKSTLFLDVQISKGKCMHIKIVNLKLRSLHGQGSYQFHDERHVRNLDADEWSKKVKLFSVKNNLISRFTIYIGGCFHEF